MSRPGLAALAVAVAVAVGLGAATARGAPVPATGEVVRVEHHDPIAPPTRGPAIAPVTIELFFVPGGNGSRQAFQQIEQLWRAHPRRIRVVYRLLLREDRAFLPVAAVEAQAEGKFFEFMDALHEARPGQSPDQFLQLAAHLGIDAGRLTAAWKDGRFSPGLADNEARRVRLHGRTVPEALFNGQPIRRPLAAAGASDLAEAYRDAYARAVELLDRGATLAELPAAFDSEAQATPRELPLQPGPTDDSLDVAPSATTALARPPLDLTGLPGVGPPDAAVPILVLCAPQSMNCYRQKQVALAVAAVFPDEVRVVWGPWFDVTRDDAAALSLLSDAALCAEDLGAGWTFAQEMMDSANRRRGRRLPAAQDVDDLAARAEVEHHALAHCLAVSAGDALARVAAARQAGVRAGPSLVVGGRIYPGGVSDQAILQGLVEAELAPGVLGAAAPGWRARAATAAARRAR